MLVLTLLLLSFLSVVGFVELLRKFNFWLFRPECRQVYIGATLTDAEEAEMTVRSLIQRIKWMNLGVPVRLVLVDRSGDPNLRKIVELFIRHYPDITLLSGSPYNSAEK